MFKTFLHVHLGSHLACKGQRARANTNPNPNQALAGLGSSLPSFGRAGGLPSPAAAWAWHPVLLSPHLAST